jgi:ssDNA-binding Zn-finger/Zn-ribbon topoisomerase 1
MAAEKGYPAGVASGLSMETDPRDMAAADTIRETRWRFRICRYFFNLGALWMMVGFLGFALARPVLQLQQEALVVFLIGFGIFTAAFTLTLAIYRCPRCDRYLSRFRPDRKKCPHCGATVAE